MNESEDRNMRESRQYSLLDELDIRRSETGAEAAGSGGGAGAAGGPEGRGGGGGGAGTEELTGGGGGGGGTGRSSVVPVPFSGAGVVSAGSSTRAEPCGHNTNIHFQPLHHILKHDPPPAEVNKTY